MMQNNIPQSAFSFDCANRWSFRRYHTNRLYCFCNAHNTSGSMRNTLFLGMSETSENHFMSYFYFNAQIDKKLFEVEHENENSQNLLEK